MAKSLLALALLGLGAADLAAQDIPQIFKEADLTYERRFANIVGVRELSDGRLLVGDAIERGVSVLDPDGVTSRRVGRTGRGPGEFSSIRAILPLPGDSSLVLDGQLLRYSVVGPTENVDRNFPMASDMRHLAETDLMMRTPRGIDADGGIYFDQMGKVQRRNGNIVSGHRTPIVRHFPLLNVIDTVAHISFPNLEERWLASPTSKMFDPGNTGFALFNVGAEPFGYQDSWGLMPDGRIVVARVERYHLDFISDGEIVESGPVVEVEPVAVTRIDRDLFLERSRRTRQGGGMSFTGADGARQPLPDRGQAPDLAFPDMKPPFGYAALRVAPDGTIWIQRNVEHDTGSVLDVFRPDGNRIYQVLLPPDRTMLMVSPTHIYTVSYNDLDEQIIERYPR